MSIFEIKKVTGATVAAGLLAGLIGGAAGSGAKLIGEKIYPPRTQGQEAPPAVLAEKLAGHPLNTKQKEVAAQTFHWSIGSLTGAVYGAAAEIAPIVTIGYGIGFGVVVLLLTHESALPILGLNEPPFKQPAREQTSELATHALYGFITEVVRRAVRKLQRSRSASMRTAAA